MRTLDDIKKSIRADFVANTTLQEAYGLDATKTFDDQFSMVSIEAILTYIVAVAIWTLENLMIKHQKDIDTVITNNALCSIPWYHAQCLNFQLGYFVQFNQDTYRFEYPQIDESARIIKFASVRQLAVEGITKLRIHVSKDNKQPLTAIEKQAFEAYIKEIGAAGIHYEIISQQPTSLSFKIQIVRNAMVIDTEGNRLNGQGNSVNEAIESYLDNIIYGGVFNRTKLVDALQSADGVVDVILNEVKVGDDVVTSQNIEAPGGAFVFDLGRSEITYTA